MLVDPRGLTKLLDALRRLGVAGDYSLEQDQWAHLVELLSERWSVGIDVHRFYPGFGASPGRAFETLWEGRERRLIAGVECDTLSKPAHALVIALHAARSNVGSAKWVEADAAVRSLAPAERAEFDRLAEVLHARAALGVRLESMAHWTTKGVRHEWQAYAARDAAAVWRHRLARSRNPLATLRGVTVALARLWERERRVNGVTRVGALLTVVRKVARLFTRG